METKKILVTDRVHEVLIDGLSKAGLRVDYHPMMDLREAKSVVTQYHGVIVNSKIICDKSFIDNASQLEFIGRLGSGLDNINLDYAHVKGITIISSPEGNANAVAEHAMGMLLGLMNHIYGANSEIKNKQLWNREANRGTEIKGKKIGILGFGHTGSAFAQKLRSMDVHILSHDKYRIIPSNLFSYVQFMGLHELLSQSDVISIHLPLTIETRMMVDDSFFSHCKRGCILINTSRGEILKLNSLVDNLETGHISGACLDVLENENLDQLNPEQKKVYTRLYQLPNTLLTPHIAGWTHESLKKIAKTLLDKILKFYKR